MGNGCRPAMVYTDYNLTLGYYRTLTSSCLFLEPFHLDIQHITGSGTVTADRCLEQHLMMVLVCFPAFFPIP